MPQLQNGKRERFCQHMATGELNQAECYSAAGYTPSSSNASILANAPEVKARIEEIKREKEEEHDRFRMKMKAAGVDPQSAEGQEEERAWDANRVRNELAKNAMLAQVTGDFKNALASIELIGKSLDMFEGKNNNGSGGGKPAGPQVAIALYGQGTGETAGGGGPLTIDGENPLRPRLPSPDAA